MINIGSVVRDIRDQEIYIVIALPKDDMVLLLGFFPWRDSVGFSDTKYMDVVLQ